MSTCTNASVVIVFYNSGPQGFINTFHNGPLTVSISGIYSNGTAFDLSSPAPGGAVITTEISGVSGDWLGSGCTFRGTSLEQPGTTYVVNLNVPDIGVHGSITIQSIAPAHYPAG